MKKGKMMKRGSFFLFPKKKKQQITIATEDAHSCVLVRSKRNLTPTYLILRGNSKMGG